MGNHNQRWELHWSWLVFVSLLLLLSVEGGGVIVSKQNCVLMVILQSLTEVFTASMDQTRSVILKEEAESARVDVTATAWIESALVIQLSTTQQKGDVCVRVPDGPDTPNHVVPGTPWSATTSAMPCCWSTSPRGERYAECDKNIFCVHLIFSFHLYCVNVHNNNKKHLFCFLFIQWWRWEETWGWWHKQQDSQWQSSRETSKENATRILTINLFLWRLLKIIHKFFVTIQVQVRVQSPIRKSKSRV